MLDLRRFIPPAAATPQPVPSPLREFLTDKGVAKTYWPERLVVLPDLPRTASGKIQKYLLREQVTN